MIRLKSFLYVGLIARKSDFVAYINKDTDQAVHSHSLICAYIICSLENTISKHATSTWKISVLSRLIVALPGLIPQRQVDLLLFYNEAYVHMLEAYK